MAVACILVPFALQTESMLRAVVDAGEAVLAFSAYLQTAGSQGEVSSRTYLGACGALYALACVQLDELLACL